RPFSLLGRTHLDEPEPPRPTRGAIGHDRSGLAASRLREKRFEIRARGRERQVPDEQLLPHGILLPVLPCCSIRRVAWSVETRVGRGPERPSQLRTRTAQAPSSGGYACGRGGRAGY